MKKHLITAIFTCFSMSTLLAQPNPTSTGNKKSIEFIDSSTQFTTIEDVLALPKFRNKLVYIDIWGTTCVPCMKQFAISKQPHKVLKQKNVEFLYICSYGQDNSSLSDRIKWKELVNKYELEGTHIYSYVLPPNKLVHEKVDMAFLLKHPGESIAYGIPMYAIAKNGHIVKFYAREPGDKDLLYNQVDSIKNIVIDN